MARRATIDPEVWELLEKFGIDPNDDTQCWTIGGKVQKIVLYHTAFERIAAQIGVRWGEVKALESAVGAEGFTVALLVTASLPDGTFEWAIGEASTLNYGGNGDLYPYAIAEKRGKDRVIAKLARLSERGVYSDIEADDFQQHDEFVQPDRVPDERPEPRRESREERADPLEVAGMPEMPQDADEWADWEKKIKAAVKAATHTQDLRNLWTRHEPILQRCEKNYSGVYGVIRAHFSTRRIELEGKEAAD